MAERIDPEAAKAAADFNATHPVGTEVDYWRGVRDLYDVGQGRSHRFEPSGRGVTTGRAMVLEGHTAVVWIDGCSGCIALTHVRVVEPAVTR